MSTNIVPPMSLEAERAVLSSALLSVEAYAEADAIIDPEHFATAGHQETWRAIRELEDRGVRADVVAVATALRDRGRLDNVGGSPYLGQLVDDTPSIANVRHHAAIVRDKWRLRELIGINRKIIAESHGDIGNIDEFLADFASSIDLVLRSKTEDTIFSSRQCATKATSDYFERKKLGKRFSGLSTGLVDLDALIGGWKRGNYYIIAGRPGQGKTGFALKSALKVASMGFGAAFISLEMPAEQVTDRAIAQQARLDTRAIDESRLGEDEGAFVEAAKRFAKLPFFIDESAGQSISTIRAAVRRCQARMRAEYHGAHLGIIVVDYIQLMRPSKESKRSRDSELADLSNGVRTMAKEFHCPVLVLSQLNRECEKRPNKRPLLSDLRDSGALEQDAFGVIMLYREDYYRQDPAGNDGLAEILVRKIRQGGSVGTVRASFHGPSTNFYDVQQADQYDWMD